MDATGMVAVVAFFVSVGGGIYLAVHELRRKERRVTRKEIDDLVGHVEGLQKLLLEATADVEAVQRLLLEQRRYIYKLVTLMIDAGMDPPQPPAPSFDPDEYAEG